MTSPRAFVRRLRRRTTPAPAAAPAARPDLRVRIDRAFESGKPARINAVLKELHELREHALELASPPGVELPVAGASGTQSLQFMVDLLPHLQKALAEHPRGSRLDVLDVGPGSGLGTALLAEMYQKRRLGYRLKVTALDIVPSFEWYLKATTPRVRFVQEDLFDHAGRYDIVIASHVIEHVPDPLPLIRRMQDVARHAVFVVAPFKEPADNLTQGHVNVIDEAFVEAMEPLEWTTMHSASWGAAMDPPYEMLIARLPGRAGPKAD